MNDRQREGLDRADEGMRTGQGAAHPEHMEEQALLERIRAQEAEIERLRAQNAELADKVRVFQSFKEIFSSMYEIDIDANRYVEMDSTASVHQFIGHSGDSRAQFDRYCHHMMTPEYTEEMLAFTDLSTMDERLRDKRMISMDYLSTVSMDGGKDVTWMRASFIEAARAADGHLTRVIFTTQSIDDAKIRELENQRDLADALAAAEHANRAKTTFLNNMSHDIRTPMNAIVGFTALAAKHVDNPDKVSEYLTKIATSSNHLLSLINDVLDMSRIESGKVRIEENEVHLPDVLHDLRVIVQSDIASKNMELFIDTLDVKDEDVICDKLRLNQILLNLLSNAIKYTNPGGTVSLRVIQRPSARENYTSFEFRVKDTGIGMSREFLRHIFQPFERMQSSTVSGIQGTGLGLSITKNIVEMMGGEISVTSEEGKGSEFVVALQFRRGTVRVHHKEIRELQGVRVLVADDSMDTCFSVSKMLIEIGMRPDWTTTGKEAVARTKFALEQNDEYGAYIIDWLMPDLNGIETVRRIRRMIGDSKPIIILTAYDWTPIEAEAREAGVTSFCSKPLFMSELREALTSSKKRETEAHRDEEMPDFKGKKLLLVEDNLLNQEIAMEILEQAGFIVDTANDGDVAVEKMRHAKEGQYDLVLMDVQMPKLDGYMATREIRTLDNPFAANIPIIAMTANAFEEDKRKAFESGMNEHIAKPIEVSRLMMVLRSVLKNRR